MVRSLFERLVHLDQTRKSFPGEHWLALGAGLWFLRKKGHSLPANLWSKAIGTALIVRAASGRDGLQKLWGGDGRGAAASGGWRGRDLSPARGELSEIPTTAPRAALLQSPEAAGRVQPEAASGVRAGGFPDFR
jgi:hypothetical protein